MDRCGPFAAGDFQVRQAPSLTSYLEMALNAIQKKFKVSETREVPKTLDD